MLPRHSAVLSGPKASTLSREAAVAIGRLVRTGRRYRVVGLKLLTDRDGRDFAPARAGQGRCRRGQADAEDTCIVGCGLTAARKACRPRARAAIMVSRTARWATTTEDRRHQNPCAGAAPSRGQTQKPFGWSTSDPAGQPKPTLTRRKNHDH